MRKLISKWLGAPVVEEVLATVAFEALGPYFHRVVRIHTQSGASLDGAD